MTMGIVRVASLAARTPPLRARGKNHVDAAPCETRGNLGELLAGFANRKVDDQVVAIDPSQLPQPLFERNVEWC